MFQEASREMTADKKRASKWPYLQYSRPGAAHKDNKDGSSLNTTADGLPGRTRVPRHRRCSLCKITCGKSTPHIDECFDSSTLLSTVRNYYCGTGTVVGRGELHREQVSVGLDHAKLP